MNIKTAETIAVIVCVLFILLVLFFMYLLKWSFKKLQKKRYGKNPTATSVLRRTSPAFWFVSFCAATSLLPFPAYVLKGKESIMWILLWFIIPLAVFIFVYGCGCTVSKSPAAKGQTLDAKKMKLVGMAMRCSSVAFLIFSVIIWISYTIIALI